MNFCYQSGGRISEERARLGLSQAAAAAACGVSREMWGKYERGKATMGSEVLAGFAHIGADALYILTGQRSQAAPGPALNRREEALLDNYRHSGEEGKNAIEGTARALAQSKAQKAKAS